VARFGWPKVGHRPRGFDLSAIGTSGPVNHLPLPFLDTRLSGEPVDIGVNPVDQGPHDFLHSQNTPGFNRPGTSGVTKAPGINFRRVGKSGRFRCSTPGVITGGPSTSRKCPELGRLGSFNFPQSEMVRDLNRVGDPAAILNSHPLGRVTFQIWGLCT